MQAKRYWIFNPAAKVIAHSLESKPEEWDFDCSEKYVIEHQITGLSLWVSNGWWFCHIYRPAREKLGIIGRTIVWKAFIKWNRNWVRKQPPPPDHPEKNQAALEIINTD